MKYVIQEGDTLKSIAEEQLDNEGKWRVVWAMNKGRMKPSATPDSPTVGVEIDIPARLRLPPFVEPSDGIVDEAVLYVNDKVFSGWKSVSIKRTLEAVAGSFTLEIVERPDEQSEDAPFTINPFDECRLMVGLYSVVTGHVDSVSIRLSKDSKTVTVSGRDKTADIVDCPNLVRPGTWKKKKIEDIAQDLCDPFDISVTTDVDTGGVVSMFRLQPGETIFEALEKECKKRNLFLTSLPSGVLIFSKAGQNSTGVVLAEGENILDIAFENDVKNRFSTYEVEGYPKKKGELDPAKTYKKGKGNGVRNGYDDPDVPRYRPTHITAEGVTNKASSALRAQWEAKQRAAKAESISVTVPGWTLPDFGLWPLNHTVIVTAPSVRIDKELLIVGIDLKKDPEAGTTTVLTLKRPDVYEELPKFPKGRGASGGSNKVDERFYRPVSNAPASEKTMQSIDNSKVKQPAASLANNPTWQWKKEA